MNINVEEVEAVHRYYDEMLKKQEKRLRTLDARGAPEDLREGAFRSIHKYKVVLAALEHYKQTEELT